MNDVIINVVDESIETLANLFKKEPTRFFTENDLVCCFHRILSNSLDAVGFGTFHDIDNCPHSLIHCEFPTPFRCDMKDKGFKLKTEHDRTPNGGKYKRGHLDIVVLNPLFVKFHSYSQIKFQNYGDIRASSILSQDEPMVLYGVELNFSREAIKPSRGKDKEVAARAFIKEVTQEVEKLIASVAFPSFMKKATMLAFTKGTSEPVISLIGNRLQNIPMGRLIVA